MTLFKNIIDCIDTDFIVAAVSVGFFTTSIFVGNYIERSKVPPVEPFDIPLKTLKESLRFIGQQERSLRKLTRNLIRFEDEINHLKYHRRRIRTVKWYWDEYLDVKRSYRKNFHHYKLIEQYIASLNCNSIKYTMNLSAVKYALMSQSETMHKLYILKPAVPAGYEPLVYVIGAYFCIVHWKLVRDLVLFILMCNGSVAVCLWKRYLFQPRDSHKTSFCNMMYVIYISVKCFVVCLYDALFGDWDGEINSKRVPRKFKDPEGPFYPYNPFSFWV